MIELDHDAFETIKLTYGCRVADALRNAGYSIIKLLDHLLETIPTPLVVTAVDKSAILLHGNLPESIYHQIMFLLKFKHANVQSQITRQSPFSTLLSLECLDLLWLFLPWKFQPHVEFTANIPIHIETKTQAFPAAEWKTDPDVQSLRAHAHSIYLKTQAIPTSLYDDEGVMPAPPDIHDFQTKYKWHRAMVDWLATADILLKAMPKTTPKQSSARPPPRPTRPVAKSSKQEAMDLLGLTPSDLSEESIKKAWKKMSLRCHPDKGGSSELQQKITNARDTLLAKIV